MIPCYRITEAGIDESGLDSLPAFPNGGIGHTDHEKVARRAGRIQVDFDIDQMSIDAVYGGAVCFVQRHEWMDLVKAT